MCIYLDIDIDIEIYVCVDQCLLGGNTGEKTGVKGDMNK